MYHPAMISRSSGKAFEATVARFARKALKLTRPDASKHLTSNGGYALRALRPEGSPSRFEAQTDAEGLWATRQGTLVWIECVGSIEPACHPGLRRSDSARKVAGTLSAMLSVCRYWAVTPPRVVIVTTHSPKELSASAEYLYWSVIEPAGRNNVDIFEGTEQIQQLVIARALTGLRVG